MMSLGAKARARQRLSIPLRGFHFTTKVDTADMVFFFVGSWFRIDGMTVFNMWVEFLFRSSGIFSSVLMLGSIGSLGWLG